MPAAPRTEIIKRGLDTIKTSQPVTRVKNTLTSARAKYLAFRGGEKTNSNPGKDLARLAGVKTNTDGIPKQVAVPAVHTTLAGESRQPPLTLASTAATPVAELPSTPQAVPAATETPAGSTPAASERPASQPTTETPTDQQSTHTESADAPRPAEPSTPAAAETTPTGEAGKTTTASTESTAATAPEAPAHTTPAAETAPAAAPQPTKEQLIAQVDTLRKPVKDETAEDRQARLTSLRQAEDQLVQTVLNMLGDSPTEAVLALHIADLREAAAIVGPRILQMRFGDNIPAGIDMDALISVASGRECESILRACSPSSEQTLPNLRPRAMRKLRALLDRIPRRAAKIYPHDTEYHSARDQLAALLGNEKDLKELGKKYLPLWLRLIILSGVFTVSAGVGAGKKTVPPLH